MSFFNQLSHGIAASALNTVNGPAVTFLKTMLCTKRAWSISIILFANSCLGAVDFDGSVELEHRYFFEPDPQNLSRGQTSIRLEFEAFTDWNNGDDQLLFEPLIRIDSEDDERTHADIRQLIWTHLGENYEFAAGIGRVFWGVVESQQLVDIINQTDGVENIDGEDKLGQPLFRYSYFSDYGTFDAFVLPYFRTRTFSGAEGRLNGGLIVDNDNEIYQARNGQSNVDFALRYSNTFGDWDLGLSWFNGTSREADLLSQLDFTTGETTPFYAQIDQFGADVQLTTGSWLIKLEAIQRNHRNNVLEDFTSATTGFEYTFVGIFGSIYDLGVLSEYSWDDRGESATTIFQNDLFVGARLALNDLSDTSILFGIVSDLDNSDSRTIFVEAATRVGSKITANIELRLFESDTPTDPVFLFSEQSFVQIGLEYFF